MQQQSKLCQNFPITLTIELLTIVMKENIFQFGNTYWMQLRGTAMGTPIAVTYANLYSGWKERSELIPKFNKNILHLSRFVDDLFGIWVPDDNENIQDDLRKYEEFKIKMNNFKPGKLKWQVENKTKQVNFLDLNISIQENGILKFKTYQKEMNPFLYLPAHSAHPPGTLKALIFGAFRRYWKQNSSTEDFSAAIQKLYQNLKRRGYNSEQLQQEFRNAAKNIDKKQNHQKMNTKLTTTNSVFFHREYHQNDMNKKELQKEIKKLLSIRNNDMEFRKLNILKTTIAYSRPKNIKDLLCPTSIFQTAKTNPKTHLQEMESKCTFIN